VAKGKVLLLPLDLDPGTELRRQRKRIVGYTVVNGYWLDEDPLQDASESSDQGGIAGLTGTGLAGLYDGGNRLTPIDAHRR